LRECAKSLLPQEVLTRSKRGFAVPIGQWFRDARLPPVANRPSPGFWNRLTAQHRSGQADNRIPLWADWILEASHIGALLTACR
jgi:hypothetical protein